MVLPALNSSLLTIPLVCIQFKTSNAASILGAESNIRFIIFIVYICIYSFKNVKIGDFSVTDQGDQGPLASRCLR
jgi:hypothetical protein